MVSFDASAAKYLAIALVVSLGVNFFLGGLVLGRAANSPAEIAAVPPPTPLPQPPGGQPASGALPRGGILQQALAALPPEHRPILRQAVEQRRRDIFAAGLAIRDARARSDEALRADSFDRAALEASLVQLRARNDALAAIFHAAVAEAAARLPVEARRDLAEWGRPRPRERAPRQRQEGR